jgi:hypothetical protein
MGSDGSYLGTILSPLGIATGNKIYGIDIASKVLTFLLMSFASQV